MQKPTPMTAKTQDEWEELPEKTLQTREWKFEVEFAVIRMTHRATQITIPVDQDNIDAFVRFYVTGDPHKAIKLEKCDED